MLGDIGPLEIAIVLVIALLVFGPKRLPDLGHGLGRGMREFKEGITGGGSGRNDGTPVGTASTLDPVASANGDDSSASASGSSASND